MLVLAKRSAPPPETASHQDTPSSDRAVPTSPHATALDRTASLTESTALLTESALAARYQLPVDTARQILSAERFNQDQVSRFLPLLERNAAVVHEKGLKALFQVEPDKDCRIAVMTPFARHDSVTQNPLSIFVNNLGFSGRVGFQQADLCEQVLSPSLRIAIDAIKAAGLTPVILKKQDYIYSGSSFSPHTGEACFVLSAFNPAKDFGNRTLGLTSGENRQSFYSKLGAFQRINRLELPSSATKDLNLKS